MEPRYDDPVAEWLVSLKTRNPDLYDDIQDHLDLLREEPIPGTARRHQYRGADGGWVFVITFRAQGRDWAIVWSHDPDGRAGVGAIASDIPL